MPAYNEETFIQHSITETAQEMERWGCPYEIVVVDDGSTDGTFREAQRATSQNSCVRVVHCEHNSGKGHALRYGFDHCNGELVAFLDADLDLHPRQLQTLYRIMQETGADVVIGSKRHPESRLDYPWHRRVISTVYFGLVKVLFGLSIQDTQTGIKLFRRQVLTNAYPRVRTSGYAFDLELLVAATRFGYRIAEAPIELDFQRQLQGRIGIRSILAMVWDTLRIFHRASFWKWLHPGSVTRFWMVAFVVGLVVASFGAANALTFLPLPAWTSRVAYYVTLKFMPRNWRSLSFIVVGALTCIGALIQLNKSLMQAFARADDGDLAGIICASSPDNARSSSNEEYCAPGQGIGDGTRINTDDTDVHRQQ